MAARFAAWPWPGPPARANAVQVLALAEALHTEDDAPAETPAARSPRPRVSRERLAELARRNDPDVRISWEDSAK